MYEKSAPVQKNPQDDHLVHGRDTADPLIVYGELVRDLHHVLGQVLGLGLVRVAPLDVADGDHVARADEKRELEPNQ
jgi:hypothetical protein